MSKKKKKNEEPHQQVEVALDADAITQAVIAYATVRAGLKFQDPVNWNMNWIISEGRIPEVKVTMTLPPSTPNPEKKPSDRFPESQ